MEVQENEWVPVDSDFRGNIPGGFQHKDQVVQLSDSGDSEIERERINSAVSSRTSSYSIAELHSAVELAAIDDNDEDDVWEQLSSLSSSNVNAVPLREEDPVLTKQELIRQIHLRRHVNQLKRNLAEKEGKVEELREQLRRCIEQISDLTSQQQLLEARVTSMRESGNTASTGLLTTQLTKVKVEVTSEEQVKNNIKDQLKEAELMLCEARLSAGQLEELEAGLMKGEELVQSFKEKRAAQRLQAEGRLITNMERAQRTMERQFESNIIDHEEKTRTAVTHAKQAQEKGKQFLHKTIERRRKEEALAGKRHRQHLENRVKAILSLKQNIDSSQGTMQAQQMLRIEENKKVKEEERRERERILAEGGNPEEVFLMRKRASQFEKEKKDFKEKQNQRQLEIVSKLLEEEKLQKRLERVQSKSHWHSRQQRPHPSKRNLQAGAKKRKKREISDDQSVLSSNAELAIQEEGVAASDEAKAEEKSRSKQLAVDSSDEEVDGDLFYKPEDKGDDPVIKKDKGEGEGEGEGLVKREKSKAELEMMQRAMEKLKKSAIIKQVAGGREFKGQAFLSKPEEVVFNDFELGRQYKKKIQLTNVSYSINYCRLVGVSTNLKDFVKIDFNPPGSMSAGLTCNMTVTFQPMLNEDIFGCIEMVSQTGHFSVPLKCLSKKCLVSTDKTSLDFGSVCLGESVCRRIILTNEGALPTTFKITTELPKTVEVSDQTVDPSSEGLVEASLSSPQGGGGPLADKSAQSIMSNVEIPPSRLKRLTSGLAIGPREEGDDSVAAMKSHSAGDLSSVSIKSLPGVDSKGGEEGQGEDGGEEDPANNEGNTAESLDTLQQQAPAAIQIGRANEGEIPGFSTHYVELVFTPEDASEHSAEFYIIFSHPDLEPIPVHASGRGIDLPIYVEREEMDLRICMMEQLYQDSVILNNRASIPHRVTFAVPPELQRHLEVVPKHCLVQAHSSFAAQLKFQPRSSIQESPDCLKFCDEERGEAYNIPVEVLVADQSRPVVFSVLAVVTSADLSFSLDSIDFGSCTVHESVVVSLAVTNHSLLTQQFGFVHLPPCVEVQPNDGFGQLLPRETLSVDVIFSAKKPKEYSFELTCKTGIDRTYKLPCSGVGVLPALELSENTITFAATPVNDRSTATISVRNPRLSRLNSAVIRGAVSTQGPKMFEFVLPEGSPFSVCPKVATLKLGQSVSVEVEFSPRLDDSAVEKEAKRLAQEKLLEEQREREEALAQEQREAAEAMANQPAGKRKGKKTPVREGDGVQARQQPLQGASGGGLVSNSKGNLASNSRSRASSSSSSHPPPTASAQAADKNSDLWWKARHNLLSNFEENKSVELSIPCFISAVNSDSTEERTTPAYRPEDTLYLDVSGPVVCPGILIVSDNGRTGIEFGSIGTGDSATKSVAIKNISSDAVQLRSSLLDPHGPFEVRNALRTLPPGQTQNLLLKFTPTKGGKFYEPLRLFYREGCSLELRLSGVAMEPLVSLSPPLEEGEEGEKVLDLGHTMAEETVTKTLELKNDTALAVRFQVEMESLLPKYRRKKRPNTFRAVNYRAPPPFDVKPTLGTIDANSTSEVTISFSPDHQSQHYSDTLDIKINGHTKYTFNIIGQAWVNNMYSILAPKYDEYNGITKDLEFKPVPYEYMSASALLPDPPQPKALILIFVHSTSQEKEGGGIAEEEEDNMEVLIARYKERSKERGVSGGKGGKPSQQQLQQPTSSKYKVVKELEVGCIKSSNVKKATGEFSIEPLPVSNPHSKLFTIEPMKSTVEAGTFKTVTITFHPPDHDKSPQAYQVDTNLTLKGESSQVQEILLRGLVCE